MKKLGKSPKPLLNMRLATFLCVIFSLIACNNPKEKLKVLNGHAIGTTYTIKYEEVVSTDFESKIDSLITAINKSTSTYIPTSDISKINAGDTTVVIDAYFEEVFQKSERIYKETEGLFDPTVGILVNAWGFGPEKPLNHLSQTQVDSLLHYVGFSKVSLDDNHITKEHSSIYFDFNAIGKGYLVDVIGRMFEAHQVSNYLIEIGGEIRARGVNGEGIPWRIAIENPNEDGTRSYAQAISLNNESIATSGNYRKYRIDEDGNKYVHTINPITGYASESNLLSASVISTKDCADVDGYATAFMAMGLEKTKDFLVNRPDLKVFLIFANEDGSYGTYNTPNLEL